MFVNVSPVQWNVWESLCSLNFAQRCRSVALGQAKANTAIVNAQPQPVATPTSSVNSESAHGPKPVKSVAKHVHLAPMDKVRVNLANKSSLNKET
jgi:hypothetical protein